MVRWGVLILLVGCTPDLASYEEGEWLPGGETTNILLGGSNAFIAPARNLSREEEGDFFTGNSLFNDPWVEAPASTDGRDGLGPFFNARSCSECHFRDGRAEPPEANGGPFLGLLFRVSVPDGDGHKPDPTYGEQLQDLALPDVAPEIRPNLTTTIEQHRFGDGSAYSLSVPEYAFTDLGYGPFADGSVVSPRIAPQVIGLGLLEAISEDDLLDLADPEDRNGDGISGRLQWSEDPDSGQFLPGRFGWKGEATTVLHQVAAAFNGDVGITSRLFPFDDCTDNQTVCDDIPSGGSPELDDNLLDKVTLYSQAVAVPARRESKSEDVLRGKRVFGQLGCDGCHTPRFVTSPDAPLGAMASQIIWPYTDLLLHDMGPALADGRPVGEASGREWKTPPLWGLGRIPEVNGHSRYLHDGRARNLEEAILWHGGEAEESKDAYADLSEFERTALLTFLEDL